ncbi:MAG: tetratricopeptide repeat protein [Deltaproteobacteria bacterium]|nr:tetratricopeptide repeat protein [Deltaproteobacteria bacterium]
MFADEDKMSSPNAAAMSSISKHDIAFLDSMVRERSPYTGVLMPSKVSIKHFYKTSSVSKRRTNRAKPKTSKRRWPRAVVAIALIAVVLGLTTIMQMTEKEATIVAISQDVTVNEKQPVSAPIETLKEQSYIEDENVEPVLEAEPQVKPNATPRVDPDKPSPMYESLLAEAKKKGTKTAKIGRLREAIEIYPKGDEALARLSIILMDSPKSRVEAFKLAKRAIVINPKNAMAWLTIGYIHQLSGRRKEAKAAYKKCASSNGPRKYIKDCRSLI